MDFLKINSFILDTLFPIACLSCGSDGYWICPDCQKKISILSTQVCPYCEKVDIPAGKICHRCRDKFLGQSNIFPLDNLICATRYQEGTVSSIIHLYKYNFISGLSEPLGKVITRGILENNCPLPDAIIPIPLHPRRERWRGFNQSELLAEYISQNLAPGFDIPVYSDLIIRKYYAKPQMKIKNYQERQKNIKNIFRINHSSHSSEDSSYSSRLKDKTILLVDDVATTGATLFECGRVLKQNGAKAVFGAVIARQEIS